MDGINYFIGLIIGLGLLGSAIYVASMGDWKQFAQIIAIALGVLGFVGLGTLLAYFRG